MSRFIITTTIQLLLCFFIVSGVQAAGTGGAYTPQNVNVTGAGNMPDISGAPNADACLGLSPSATCNCLNNAIANAGSKPLVINSGTYTIDAPLKVTTSLIGAGSTQPHIHMNAGHIAWNKNNILDVNASNIWIYNLHLSGTYSSGGMVETDRSIFLWSGSNITIKNNLIENSTGDNIELGDKAGVTNVYIDNNTLKNPGRCSIFPDVADRVWIGNNVIGPQFNGSAIDFEPDFNPGASHIEIAYNRFEITNNPTTVIYGWQHNTDWGVTIPGGNNFIHHNFGYWPAKFFEPPMATGPNTWGPFTVNNNIQGTYTGINFTCDREVNVQAGGNFSFQCKYDNATGSTATITYLKKPSWIIATNGNQTITGTAPNKPSLDTVIAVASAGSKSDTLRLAITVSSYYFIEAESGQLAAPMQIGSDPTASKGQYITTPAGTGNTIFPKIEVTYTFNAPVAGTYYVWLRTYTQTINTTANYGTFVGFNGKFGKPGIANKTAGQYEWYMSGSANTLTAGANQLILGHGGEQVRVDQIIITNSSSPQLPTGVTSALPKKNVKQQKQNLSIRIAPNGSIQFLSGVTSLENIHLSVLDIFGREIWSNQGERSNGMVRNPGNGSLRINNGVYFVMLQQKDGLSSEVAKFALAR